MVPNTLLLNAGQCTYSGLPSRRIARDTRYKVSFVPDPNEKPFVAVLLVCRLSYEDVGSILYRDNTFAANGGYCRSDLIFAEQQLARIEHLKLYLLLHDCSTGCPLRTLRYFAGVCQSLKNFELHLGMPRDIWAIITGYQSYCPKLPACTELKATLSAMKVCDKVVFKI